MAIRWSILEHPVRNYMGSRDFVSARPLQHSRMMGYLATSRPAAARVVSRTNRWFWDRQSGPSTPGILTDALRELHLERRSGVLFLRAVGLTDLEIHLQEGRIIACGSDADDWQLARLVLATRVVSAAVLKDLLDQLEYTWLPDLLVASKLMSEQDVLALIAEVVRDNLMAACTASWYDIWFIGGDTTFPTRMQLHLDTRRLLVEAASWHSWVRPLLELIEDDPDQVVAAGADARPNRVEHRMVASLAREPIALDRLVAVAPLPRHRTLDALVHLVAQGSIDIWPREEGPERGDT